MRPRFVLILFAAWSVAEAEQVPGVQHLLVGREFVVSASRWLREPQLRRFPTSRDLTTRQDPLLRSPGRAPDLRLFRVHLARDAGHELTRGRADEHRQQDPTGSLQEHRRRPRPLQERGHGGHHLRRDPHRLQPTDAALGRHQRRATGRRPGRQLAVHGRLTPDGVSRRHSGRPAQRAVLRRHACGASVRTAAGRSDGAEHPQVRQLAERLRPARPAAVEPGGAQLPRRPFPRRLTARRDGGRRRRRCGAARQRRRTS